MTFFSYNCTLHFLFNMLLSNNLFPRGRFSFHLSLLSFSFTSFEFFISLFWLFLPHLSQNLSSFHFSLLLSHSFLQASCLNTLQRFIFVWVQNCFMNNFSVMFNIMLPLSSHISKSWTLVSFSPCSQRSLKRSCWTRSCYYRHRFKILEQHERKNSIDCFISNQMNQRKEPNVYGGSVFVDVNDLHHCHLE